ncbi:MAG: hypothetical protein AAB372_02280 [Patescibacteria group bacterium]
MERGFVQLIVIILLAIVILSLLGVQLSKLTDNPTLRDNLSFVWRWLIWIWEKIGPATVTNIKNAFQSIRSLAS